MLKYLLFIFAMNSVSSRCSPESAKEGLKFFREHFGANPHYSQALQFTHCALGSQGLQLKANFIGQACTFFFSHSEEAENTQKLVVETICKADETLAAELSNEGNEVATFSDEFLASVGAEKPEEFGEENFYISESLLNFEDATLLKKGQRDEIQTAKIPDFLKKKSESDIASEKYEDIIGKRIDYILEHKDKPSKFKEMAEKANKHAGLDRLSSEPEKENSGMRPFFSEDEDETDIQPFFSNIEDTRVPLKKEQETFVGEEENPVEPREEDSKSPEVESEEKEIENHFAKLKDSVLIAKAKKNHENVMNELKNNKKFQEAFYGSFEDEFEAPEKLIEDEEQVEETETNTQAESSAKPLTKNQKKNLKRKEKRANAPKPVQKLSKADIQKINRQKIVETILKNRQEKEEQARQKTIHEQEIKKSAEEKHEKVINELNDNNKIQDTVEASFENEYESPEKLIEENEEEVEEEVEEAETNTQAESSAKPLTKNQKKNLKRKEKRANAPKPVQKLSKADIQKINRQKIVETILKNRQEKEEQARQKTIHEQKIKKSAEEKHENAINELNEEEVEEEVEEAETETSAKPLTKNQRKNLKRKEKKANAINGAQRLSKVDIKKIRDQQFVEAALKNKQEQEEQARQKALREQEIKQSAEEKHENATNEEEVEEEVEEAETETSAKPLTKNQRKNLKRKEKKANAINGAQRLSKVDIKKIRDQQFVEAALKNKQEQEEQARQKALREQEIKQSAEVLEAQKKEDETIIEQLKTHEKFLNLEENASAKPAKEEIKTQKPEQKVAATKEDENLKLYQEWINQMQHYKENSKPISRKMWKRLTEDEVDDTPNGQRRLTKLQRAHKKMVEANKLAKQNKNGAETKEQAILEKETRKSAKAVEAQKKDNGIFEQLKAHEEPLSANKNVIDEPTPISEEILEVQQQKSEPVHKISAPLLMIKEHGEKPLAQKPEPVHKISAPLLMIKEHGEEPLAHVQKEEIKTQKPEQKVAATKEDENLKLYQEWINQMQHYKENSKPISRKMWKELTKYTPEKTPNGQRGLTRLQLAHKKMVEANKLAKQNKNGAETKEEAILAQEIKEAADAMKTHNEQKQAVIEELKANEDFQNTFETPVDEPTSISEEIIEVEQQQQQTEVEEPLSHVEDLKEEIKTQKLEQQPEQKPEQKLEQKPEQKLEQKPEKKPEQKVASNKNDELNKLYEQYLNKLQNYNPRSVNAADWYNLTGPRLVYYTPNGFRKPSQDQIDAIIAKEYKKRSNKGLLI